MEPMNEAEQADHKAACDVIRSTVSALRLTRVQDEDVQVALARLENWLAENDGRWVAEPTEHEAARRQEIADELADFRTRHGSEVDG